MAGRSCQRAPSVVQYYQSCWWVFVVSAPVVCPNGEADWGWTFFSSASSHRLGPGGVLSPLSGVQRQSGISILQRSRAPCWLSGLTPAYACWNQPVALCLHALFSVRTRDICRYVSSESVLFRTIVRHFIWSCFRCMITVSTCGV